MTKQQFEEIGIMLSDVLRSELSAKPQGKPRRQSMTLSHKLIVFAAVMFLLTWCVAVASWFMSGRIPAELLANGTALFGFALAVYGGKSMVENKSKIESAYRLDEEAYND